VELFSRAEVGRSLWQVAEHNITAEMICCDPLEPGHDLCARGYTALDVTRELFIDNPDAHKPSPLLDAVMQLLTAQAQLNQTIKPPDAPTILAARHLDATEGPVQVGRYVDQSTRSAIDRVLQYVASAHNARTGVPVEICERPHQSTEEEEECERRRVSSPVTFIQRMAEAEHADPQDILADSVDLLREAASVYGTLGSGRKAHWLTRMADELEQDRPVECTASLSGTCLHEAESEPVCDTEAGECAAAGKPGDSPALQRLKAAAHDATEAAHVHAMHAMKRVFRLCVDHRGRLFTTAEVLDALGLDENANTTVDLPGAADRAAIYAEVADRLAVDAELGEKEGFTRIYQRATAKKVREWASEPVPETCGRTRSTNGGEYAPCGRPPRHAEAYCFSKDGSAYFLAVNVIRCPRCRDDISDYAEDDFVYLKDDPDRQPYCSTECVIDTWRAAHPTETGISAQATALLGAAEGGERLVLNITPIDPDTLDADEEVEESDIDLTEPGIDRMMENGTPVQIVASEETAPKTKGWGGMRGE